LVELAKMLVIHKIVCDCFDQIKREEKTKTFTRNFWNS
jgi:hypothetical protein